jgi:hypothetical protein
VHLSTVSLVIENPQLILVLRNPMMISRVEILSRQDCCWERLAGAMIALVDEKK